MIENQVRSVTTGCGQSQPEIYWFENQVRSGTTGCGQSQPEIYWLNYYNQFSIKKENEAKFRTWWYFKTTQ